MIGVSPEDSELEFPTCLYQNVAIVMLKNRKIVRSRCVSGEVWFLRTCEFNMLFQYLRGSCARREPLCPSPSFRFLRDRFLRNVLALIDHYFKANENRSISFPIHFRFLRDKKLKLHNFINIHLIV